ncbi:hypothetical protein EDD21DRAFT_356799 [Dissophora ornata]|nr:hypothetical protein EDD21DRAFT_356799 [Dissophora ornata]
MLHSQSVTGSPSVTSESAFSSDSTTDPTTPATSCDLDQEYPAAMQTILKSDLNTAETSDMVDEHKQVQMLIVNKPSIDATTVSAQEPGTTMTDSNTVELDSVKFNVHNGSVQNWPLDNESSAETDGIDAHVKLELQGHEPAVPEPEFHSTVDGRQEAIVNTTSLGESSSTYSLHPEPTSELVSETPAKGESAPSLPLWDVASEHVATVALQCLSKDKDMELSYVSILSAMTVLQSVQDQPFEQEELSDNAHQYLQDARKTVAKAYSRILKIMCRSNIAESLEKETLRQGIMSSEALYTQFYGSIQQAGYDLEDEAHLAMAQYWIRHKKFEEAQDCLGHIESVQWTGPAYREAITCLLFSKPRHVLEAETLLQKYLEFCESDQGQKVDDELKVRTWYKLQVEASKWEEVKSQYERRRARLIDGPGSTERASISTDAESRLTPLALQQHQLQEQLSSPQRLSNITRSKSITSSTTTSSHRRSPSRHPATSPSGHQRTPSVAPSWPSGASAPVKVNTSTATPAPAKGAFSFLSSLKFTMGSDAEVIQSSSAALPSRLNVNHHLTVLDNGMLEECINYKEFEYGWRQIYEKMGSALEDSDTARIAMRLCRRAFLGHSGLDPNHPGSSNLMAKDMRFEDGLDSAEQSELETTPTPFSSQDPEIWEARAWVIYTKAMMNPHFLASSTGSTAHPQPSAALVNRVNGPTASGNLSLLGSNGATPASLFLHDILTIANHSPEVSSRYLKAFKVYSALRSDQQNQHQLRDPFVMSCMIKAIYDATLTVVLDPDQLPLAGSRAEAMKHQRRSSSLPLNQLQPMTLGPLIDLAFEIYADMRNVGPIRHLSSLINLPPSSPRVKGHKTSASTSSIATACTTEIADIGRTSTTSSVSVSTMLSFQDLNPTLKFNPQARHLPTEFYLALLHLCIQVPLFKISSQVVKTILEDMNSDSGRPLNRLDYHLAAALQFYHDTRLCPFETTEDAAEVTDSDVRQGKRCDYHEWMYQSDEALQEYIRTSSAVSDALANSSAGVDAESATEIIEKEGLEDSHLPLDGGEQETCNGRFYWDLWSSDDTALTRVQYSRIKARMLVEHIMRALS